MQLTVVLSLVFGAFAQGFLGFGGAALMVALLTLQLTTQEAVGQVVSIAPVNVITAMILQHREVAYRGMIPLIVITLLVFPVGVVLLYAAPEAALRIALGGIVMFAAATQLLSRRVALLPTGRLGGVIASVLSGLFGGAIGIPGLTMTAYLYGREKDPARARASLQFFFLFTMTIALTLHIVAGTVTRQTILTALVAAVPVALSVFTGLRLARQVPTERLRYVYAAALGLLGLYTIGRALF